MIAKFYLEHKQSGEYNKKVVEVTSAKNIIASDTIFYSNSSGEPLGLYLTNVIQDDRFAKTFYDIKYSSSHRLSGIKSESEIFGFAPRDYIKRLCCRSCAFNKKNPVAVSVLKKLMEVATEKYKLHLEDQFQKHALKNVKINQNWKLNELYTSGIINMSNQLVYHTDNGNVPGTFSSMYTFKKDISEGYLHLPEYDAIIKNENNSLLIFNGQAVLHGVTPFKKTSPNSKRVTIVFYALENLEKCEPDIKSEIEYMNKRQAEKLWT